MRPYVLMPLLFCWHSAHAGEFMTEEQYANMAELIVVAEVIEANCLSVEETDTVRRTQFTATLWVQSTEKGELSSENITLESSVSEYGDEMGCSDPGSVHPVGEIAKYHLKATDTMGVYRNIDAGSTFETMDSAPDDVPTCLDEQPKDTVDEPKACTTVAPLATLSWFLPFSFVLVRSRRKTCVNSMA